MICSPARLVSARHDAVDGWRPEQLHTRRDTPIAPSDKPRSQLQYRPHPARHNREQPSQHPVGRVGTPLDIASMVLFLCSDQAGFITGKNITIDGGMTKQMIYHDDFGWKYK